VLVRFLLCAFSFNVFCLNFSSVTFDSKEVEFDVCEEKIAICDHKSVVLVDKKTSEKKKIFEFEIKQRAISKIVVSKDCVFLNTEDSVFKSIDFSGKTIFENKLPAVSRSDMFFSDGNLFFSLINQYVVCYSKDGVLLWVNRDNQTSDLVFKNSLRVGKYVYVLNRSGFMLLDKRSGLCLSSFEKMKSANGFYVVNDSVVYSISDHDFISHEIMSSRTTQEKEYFPKKFVSRGFVYSYSDGVLKNIKNGKEYNVDAQSFVFADEKVFVFNKNTYNYDELLIIDGDSVVVEKLPFKIHKMIYKNGTFVAFDGERVYWASL